MKQWVTTVLKVAFQVIVFLNTFRATIESIKKVPSTIVISTTFFLHVISLSSLYAGLGALGIMMGWTIVWLPIIAVLGSANLLIKVVTWGRVDWFADRPDSPEVIAYKKELNAFMATATPLQLQQLREGYMPTGAPLLPERHRNRTDWIVIYMVSGITMTSGCAGAYWATSIAKDMSEAWPLYILGFFILTSITIFTITRFAEQIPKAVEIIKKLAG